MSSTTNIALRKNADKISFTLLISQVGTFQVQAQAEDHPSLTVTWELFAPDNTIFSRSNALTNITEDVLQRYRDSAGVSSRLWTLRLLSAQATRVAIPLNTIDCSATITSVSTGATGSTGTTSSAGSTSSTGSTAAVNSDSGPPIVDTVLALGPKQSHTYDININRVGDLVVTVAPKTTLAAILIPQFKATIQLFDPSNRPLTSGTNRISHPFTLQDLHAGHAPGALWHVTITQESPSTQPQLNEFTVEAQVYDTLTIPAIVLQPRLDAILGDPTQGGDLRFRVSYDDKRKNIVYIKISENLYFTLDNFGLLDSFETMRSTQFDGTTSQPAPIVPLDPGLTATDPWYPITTFDGGFEIHNLETGGIAALVANAGGKPAITLTVPMIHSPNGQITKLTQPWTNNINPLNDPGGSAELKDATFHVVLTIVPDGKGGLVFSAAADLPVFIYNLIDLPDWLKDVKGKVQQSVQDGANKALGSATFLPSIFKVLMGGQFTIQSATSVNNTFQFEYIPGMEEAPHQISPKYSARGTTPPGTAPQWTSPNLQKIDHIVVLMMENRSFDHVLGHLSLTGGRSDLDGLTPAIINSFDADNQPTPLTETRLPFDPDHSFIPVKVQLGPDPAHEGPMRGFVTSFLEKYPFMATPGPARKVGDGVSTGDDPYWIDARRSYEKNAVMRYHTDQTLPYYAFLAKEYMVCDRWYSSHPGPTLPNRFFYLMGHLSVDASGEPQPDNSQQSLELVRSRTIQDALTERGVNWKMYESPPDVCMLRMFARYAFDDTNIRPMDEFLASARAGTLASVSFLEPNFHMGVATNDDHPPCDMANGQALLQSVHDALTANQNAWSKTLLILTYDEHGGLYDHHPPELADRYTTAGQPNVDLNYGVRVPGLVISPWVPAGSSTHQVFDHTSILKTIVNRFCPNDPAIMSDRMAFANDLFPLLTLTTPRTASPLKVGAGVSGAVANLGALHVSESAPASAAAPAAPVPRIAARTMIADAKAVNAPVPRNSKLFQGDADWHQYMTRLGLMLK